MSKYIKEQFDMVTRVLLSIFNDQYIAVSFIETADAILEAVFRIKYTDSAVSRNIPYSELTVRLVGIHGELVFKPGELTDGEVARCVIEMLGSDTIDRYRKEFAILQPGAYFNGNINPTNVHGPSGRSSGVEIEWEMELNGAVVYTKQTGLRYAAVAQYFLCNENLSTYSGKIVVRINRALKEAIDAEDQFEGDTLNTAIIPDRPIPDLPDMFVRTPDEHPTVADPSPSPVSNKGNELVICGKYDYPVVCVAHEKFYGDIYIYHPLVQNHDGSVCKPAKVELVPNELWYEYAVANGFYIDHRLHPIVLSYVRNALQGIYYDIQVAPAASVYQIGVWYADNILTDVDDAGETVGFPG